MLAATVDQIRVPGQARGRPRLRPDRLIADKGYPSKTNRAWLRERGIAAPIPERDDQIAHRRKRPGRPIDFGDQQQDRYKGRNVVERCFNKLKQWRGIAMRSDKTASSYHAGLCLAATLHWTDTTFLGSCLTFHVSTGPLRLPTRLGRLPPIGFGFPHPVQHLQDAVVQFIWRAPQ